MKKLQVYVGCALAYGPQRYTKEIATFKKKLGQIPWIVVLEFCTPPPGERQSVLPPGDIYKNDIIDGVGNADVVIGELSYPSTGLGGELMAAIKDSTRTMMFAKENKRVSALWIGAPVHHDCATFERYSGSFSKRIPTVALELERIYRELYE